MKFLSFRRITASGNFIPEIDGLRFIAIISVVLFHLSGFLVVKAGNAYTNTFEYSYFKNIFARGHVGVPLFFAISGFILGMPFAKFFIKNGPPVILKKYFFRRITRLEPPYILVMTLLLFASVFIVKNLSVDQAVKSYFSSIFYIHNFVYGKGVRPLLNAVAWSLEIEVQFYILAPLLSLLFKIKAASKRRWIILGIAILFSVANYFIDLQFISVINYMHYFLIGFLLVDLYISNCFLFSKTKFDNLIGLLCLAAIWVFDVQDNFTRQQNCLYELIQLFSIFLFYYYVLIHKVFKILHVPVITNIGGMCYSIYLIHTQIISMLGNYILKHSFSKISCISIFIYQLLIITAVLVISAAFFLCVERPCMDRNWYKKFIAFASRAKD